MRVTVRSGRKQGFPVAGTRLRRGVMPAMLTFILALFLTACSRQPEYPSPIMEGSDVVIEVGSLEPGIPQFRTYHYDGKKVSFFIVKIDSEVMSFLDACNACYTHKRGYQFKNGLMICRYCREKYPLSHIAIGTGNCHPIKIPGRILNSRYLISVSTLEKHASKF